MSNLVHRERGGNAIDFNGDNMPDAYVHEIVTQRVSATINPREDNAVGKILMVTIATVLTRPINTLKEFWGWGCLVIGVIYFLVAWGSSKAVIPPTNNFADNFRPDVIGAGLGRTAKSVTTSVADSANAAEVTPTTSLSRKTKVSID
jgi:hypothetical protein